MDVALSAAFLLGFVTGFKHAFEPDHVIAVSTLLHRDEKLASAVRTGVAWGAGHTTMLMGGVAIVGLLRIELSSNVLALMELPVAVMLFVLGAWALAISLRNLGRLRKHTHDGLTHVHVGEHDHPHTFTAARTGWRGYFVGVVHGLAGSGAVVLLAAATLPSLGHSLFYALLFGAGSVLGMGAVTVVLAYPFLASKKRPTFHSLLTGTSGALSIFLAVWIAWGIL